MNMVIKLPVNTQVMLEKYMNFLKGENCEKAKEIIL